MTTETARLRVNSRQVPPAVDGQVAGAAKVVDRHTGPSRASGADATTQLLVVGRIGGMRYAWPAACVERVLPMAAVTQVANLPSNVAGVIDVHGDTLAVVDPRPRLGIPSLAAHPEQHLLLLQGTVRFLVWVDCVEAMVTVSSNTFEAVQGNAGEASTAWLTRVDGELVSVLSLAAFDPGPVVQAMRDSR